MKALFLTVLVAVSVYPLATYAQEVAYSAHFKLGTQNLKFVIKKSLEGPSAEITSGSQVQAQCEVRNIERDETSRPMSVGMSCQSPAFKPLSSTVTLFWPGSNPQGAPVLRFGTWLGGYEQAKLQVDVDRYSKPELSRSPAAPARALEKVSFRPGKKRMVIKVARAGI